MVRYPICGFMEDGEIRQDKDVDLKARRSSMNSALRTPKRRKRLHRRPDEAETVDTLTDALEQIDDALDAIADVIE